MNRHSFACNLLSHMRQKVDGPVQGFKAQNWFRRILSLTCGSQIPVAASRESAVLWIEIDGMRRSHETPLQFDSDKLKVSKKLGNFRMCATDPQRSVVLHFPSRRWVISPDRPSEFVQALKEQTGLR